MPDNLRKPKMPPCERCNSKKDVIYAGDDGDMGYGDFFCLNCGIYFYATETKYKIFGV